MGYHGRGWGGVEGNSQRVFLGAPKAVEGLQGGSPSLQPRPKPSVTSATNSLSAAKRQRLDGRDGRDGRMGRSVIARGGCVAEAPPHTAGNTEARLRQEEVRAT